MNDDQLPLTGGVNPRRRRGLLYKLDALVDVYDSQGKYDTPVSVTEAQAKKIKKRNPVHVMQYRGHPLNIIPDSKR